MDRNILGPCQQHYLDGELFVEGQLGDFTSSNLVTHSSTPGLAHIDMVQAASEPNLLSPADLDPSNQSYIPLPDLNRTAQAPYFQAHDSLLHLMKSES